MKKIILNFIGTGYKDLYQAKVHIYDKNNRLIYNETTYNGQLILCLKPNNYYRVTARFYSEYIDTILYVNNYKSDYYLVFNHSIINNNTSHSVTFLLTDYYYDNLKIEKGEMVLWPKQ